MVQRIYVNNFRSLVNLDVSLEPLCLFMGPNGTGKSSVFDAVSRVAHLVTSQIPVHEAFPPETVSWFDIHSNERSADPVQVFELELNDRDLLYYYRLVVVHGDNLRRTTVISEELRCGTPLMRFEDGEMQVFTDSATALPKYPFDGSRSALGSVVERPDCLRLT